MRDDIERIRDIQEAIERIARYSARGRGAFDNDELIQNWIVRHLQLIGEAARGISSTFAETHPEIPWSQVIGMRNILVHRYFDIDKDVVWSVVEHDLSPLKAAVEAILQEQSGNN